MSNKKMIATLIIATVAIISVTAAVTYSFLSINAAQTETNDIGATCFSVSLNDNSGNNAISLNTPGHYAYPMTETKATSTLTPYTFTITNNCTSLTATDSIKYDILINTLTSPISTLTPYLDYRLDITSATNNSLVANGATTSLTSNSTNYVLNASAKTGTNADILESYRIGSNTLAPGASVTYRLYLWIDNNACSGNACQTTVMGKIFEGKLMIYPYMS